MRRTNHALSTRTALLGCTAALALAASPAMSADPAPAAAPEAPVEATVEAAAPLDGLAIATKADTVSRSDTEHSVMTMTLENSRGQQRVRTIEGWSREVDEDRDDRFSRFLKPSDVKDTTLLTYDYDHTDDDIWLYLPALKKVKRILSSNKTDYFMGSDFTYEDMENRDLVNWTYTLLGTDTLKAASRAAATAPVSCVEVSYDAERKTGFGWEVSSDGGKDCQPGPVVGGDVECYVVEAVPQPGKEADESGYTKTISWIGKEDFVSRQTLFIDKKGRMAKRMTTDDIRLVGTGVQKPRAHKLRMENFVKKHKTELSMSKVEINIEVSEKTFSQRNLKQ